MLHLHDGVGVRKDGAVAVAKVEAPDFDVLVGGAADEEGGVGADIHAEHGQLVAIQGQEELQRVHEEHLHHLINPRDQVKGCVDSPVPRKRQTP